MITTRHLLVVDDDPTVADVMRMGLEADGTCRVTMAPGAAEALAVLEGDRPHAAIIDVVLPRIPGLVLARTALDLGVPVLMVTGEFGIQQELTKAGCPILLKPFRISQLVIETRTLFDEATSRMQVVTRSLDRLLAVKKELAEVREQTRRVWKSPADLAERTGP